MLNARVKGLGGRVLREAEDVATPDAGQAAGPGDQQEAQGPHATHDVGVGALAGPAARGGDGVELKAPSDVVGEDAELLPGAVGPVVAGRDDVERELALEFGDRLLLGAPAADEGVERRQRQRQVGRDGLVLPRPGYGARSPGQAHQRERLERVSWSSSCNFGEIRGTRGRTGRGRQICSRPQARHR